MFAKEMLVEEMTGNGRHAGGKLQRMAGHRGHNLQRQGVLDGLWAARAPGEGAVAVDQDGADLHRVDLTEALDDDVAGLPFVSAGDFLGRQRARHGDLAVEIIGVRGAEARDATPGLGEGNGLARVRVDDGTNVRKREE